MIDVMDAWFENLTMKLDYAYAFGVENVLIKKLFSIVEDMC